MARDLAGTEIDYEGDNVSFVVDGDTLKVMADVTVTKTEEQFIPSYWYASKSSDLAGRAFYEDAYAPGFFRIMIFGGGDGERHVELISQGIATTTEQVSGVIWEAA